MPPSLGLWEDSWTRASTHAVTRERHGRLPVVAPGREQAADPAQRRPAPRLRSPSPASPFLVLERPLRLLPGVTGADGHQMAVLPAGCSVALSWLKVNTTPSRLLRVQGDSRGDWGYYAPSACFRLTRGPGKNTQIPGSRGNISQSAPSPRLMEDKSPPLLRSPHRRGSPASIQYSDPRAESDKGVAGWQGVSARFPSLPHGIRPCQSASGPFPRPCGQGCCVLDQAAGPGRSPTGDSPKLGPAHPGGPVES